MKTRVLGLSIITVTIALMLPGVALAGGWSVVTLDNVPTDLVASKEVRIGFRVLHHGQRPMEGLAAHILATHQESGQKATFTATDGGTPGHYTTTITLPEAGVWDWAVVAYGSHPMYPLAVRPAAEERASPPGEQSTAPRGPAASGFWNRLAVGSGIAGALTLLAAVGVTLGLLSTPPGRRLPR